MSASLKRTILAGGLAAIALAPVSAMAWTRSFLVQWMEPAFYFAGGAGGSPIAPGADCPNGVNTMDWSKLLVTSYRPASRVAEISDPEYSRPMFLSHLGFRGPHKENVYENPTSVPDPGLIEVQGKVAEGLDLDDNPNTGFTGIDGTRGVDNGFYKVVGCTDFFRGRPRQAFSNKNVNEQMESRMTLLMVVSGDKDPMNDPDVKVGIYSSLDQATKDPTGAFSPDYSFRIDPKDQSVFKGRIVGGVLESVDRPTINIRFSSKRMPARFRTDLFESKVRIVFNPDGTANALLGGYRDIRKLYLEMHVSTDIIPSSQTENLGHFSLPGMFYSLRRNADGLVDPETGIKRGISAAYRMDLIPAFVIEPKGVNAVKVAQYFEGQG